MKRIIHLVITFLILADKYISLKKEVATNGKIQTPQLNYSPAVESNWSIWRIK